MKEPRRPGRSGPAHRRLPALLLALPLAALAEAPAPPPGPAEPVSGRVTRDGVVVDFSIGRAGEASGAPLLEGEYAEVRFAMTDAASGRPVTGLKPAAWMDMANVVAGRGGEQRECKEKIGLYLKGVVGIRPLVDLNSYYLLVLNADASISVVDPVVSMTGNTSLFATVVLKRPGADWAKGTDDKRLYVSMPKADEVAVVDAETFKVTATLPAGPAPTRVALRPDGRQLWVGNDARAAGESGVSIIDLASGTLAGRVITGRGHHELAFSADGRLAFVSNRDAGTVTVIDTATLATVKDLEVGGVPIALATSSLSQSVYVAEARGGRVLVVDPATLRITARVAASPGLGPTRFSQDGRWGLVVNPAEHAVHVVDASTNRLVQTVPVGGQPYQVSFTRAYAYVRLLDSEQVKMINLASLGEGRKAIVQGFQAGSGAPMAAGELSLADATSPATTEAAVFTVNPADGNTYFYMEGMNAPMGHFSGYGHRVQAITVVDRSLKELSPGVYGGRLRLPAAGHYDVAFLLDSPRVLHCFGAEALPNPALARRAGLAVEFLDLPYTRPVGGEVTVRVKVTDGRSGAPRPGLADVQLAWHQVPGRHPAQATAREVGGGVYEATLGLQRAGLYYVFASVPSLRVAPNQVLFRTVQVEQDGPVTAGEGSHVRVGSTP